ncbi:MAG: inositol monophosphatase [Desulfobacteraceae bacterium]|nr:MAG: inositol monophosphatase [Desulfobacteraceae bacterium]
MDLDQMMRVAERAAYRAGEIVRLRFGHLERVDEKAPFDLVTDADTAAETAILDVIHRACPGHAVVAEESGTRVAEASDYTWLVDPLDGTVNYAHQLPFAAVSIALAKGREPLVAAVLNPFSGELFSAVAGRGTRLNGEPVRVSPAGRVADSLLATGFPYDRSRTGALVGRLERFIRAARGIRRFGSAALDLCFVACGRFAGYWEQGLKPWDTAAGLLIVREAGGRVTDFSGRPFAIGGDEILASNRRIHDEMLALLMDP